MKSKAILAGIALLCSQSAFAQINLSLIEQEGVCVGDKVRYRCTADRAESALRWTVRQEGTPIDTTSYIQQDMSIRLHPLRINTPARKLNSSFDASTYSSELAYTLTPEIDGLEVCCQKSGTNYCDVDDNQKIFIRAEPKPPTDITLTENEHSIEVSWNSTELSAECSTWEYQVDVSPSNANWTTNDTCLEIPFSSLRPTKNIINVSEKVLDSEALSTGAPVILTLDAPGKPSLTAKLTSLNGELSVYQLSWSFDEIKPALLNVLITVDENGVTIKNDSLPSHENQYQLPGFRVGSDYGVKVQGVNYFGAGQVESLPFLFKPQLITSTIFSAVTATTTVTNTISVTKTIPVTAAATATHACNPSSMPATSVSDGASGIYSAIVSGTVIMTTLLSLALLGY